MAATLDSFAGASNRWFALKALRRIFFPCADQNITTILCALPFGIFPKRATAPASVPLHPEEG
jgi:hypothetical protein